MKLWNDGKLFSFYENTFESLFNLFLFRRAFLFQLNYSFEGDISGTNDCGKNPYMNFNFVCTNEFSYEPL